MSESIHDDQNGKRRSNVPGDEIKRPAFMHYPNDEEKDPGIEGLSLAAFGLWRHMLNLMHAGRPYGHLTNGTGLPLDELAIAKRVRERRATVSRLLRELELEGIFSRTANGVIYSRRMVRDEYKRNVRAAGGEKALENPNVPRPKEPAKDTRKDGAKDGRKDTAKDGAKDTLPPSSGGSLGVSPSVAVAGAGAVSGLSAAAAAAPPQSNGKPGDASSDDESTLESIPGYVRLKNRLPSDLNRLHLRRCVKSCPVHARHVLVSEYHGSLDGMEGLWLVTIPELCKALRDTAAEVEGVPVQKRGMGFYRGRIGGALPKKERERQEAAIEALRK